MISSLPLVQSSTKGRHVLKSSASLFSALSVLWLLGTCAHTEAAVISATSPSLADVQTAVNSASPGDIVRVPAGTDSWTGTLTISKDIQLIGAGVDQTIIVDGGATALELISWNTVPNGSPRLSGFTFQGNNNAVAYGGSIWIGGACASFRLDHCNFNLLRNANINVNNAVFGVIDHCHFIQTWANAVSVTSGSPSDPYGDTSWATPVQWGSTNFLYIESCSFYYPTYPWPGVDDLSAGSRVVFRYNSVTNEFFQDHGTESGQRYRGGRAFEVYCNVFTNTTAYSGDGNPIYLRSGTGVIFSNQFNSFGAFSLNNMRASGYFPPWGGANGQNPWDTNATVVQDSGTATAANASGVLTDSTKNWSANQWVGGYGNNTNCAYEIQDVTQGGTNTGQFSIIVANTADTITTASSDGGAYISWNTGDNYRIYKVYYELDQIGLGQGDLLTGDNPYDTVTGQPTWPNEIPSPMYQWSNTDKGSIITLGQNARYPIIISNRDYINGIKPGYAPLAYPHPLVSGISTPSSYTLTVNGGVGSGTYSAGSIVTISAISPGGEPFVDWTGSDIANTTSATTTVTMPASNLTVTAIFDPPSPPTGLRIIGSQ